MIAGNASTADLINVTPALQMIELCCVLNRLLHQRSGIAAVGRFDLFHTVLETREALICGGHAGLRK